MYTNNGKRDHIHLIYPLKIKPAAGSVTLQTPIIQQLSVFLQILTG